MANADKKNKTSFKIGNQDSLKWTREKTIEKFDEMRSNALEDENVLCLQDAIFAVGLYRSSLDYLISKHPDLADIKKDIQDIIISRINKEALKGERAGGFSASASIWRMKQCGERDSEVVNKNINYNSENMSKDEIKDISDKLEDDY